MGIHCPQCPWHLLCRRVTPEVGLQHGLGVSTVLQRLGLRAAAAAAAVRLAGAAAAAAAVRLAAGAAAVANRGSVSVNFSCDA